MMTNSESTSQHRLTDEVECTEHDLHEAKSMGSPAKSEDAVKKGRLATWRDVWDRLILNTWFPELFAMLLSIACILAIVIILRIYSGKTIPRLPYGITLNAIVSILATASKTALLYVVASAISQLKWCWFQKDQRLQDIQSFDDASRGPWGAFALLFGVRARSMASLGAAVTLLALAYDPFVQQIIRYPPRMAESSFQAETVRRGTRWPHSAGTAPFVGSIISGIWTASSQFKLSPSCPSGNCRWPSYTSFEWCTKCEDVRATSNVTCEVSPKHGNASYHCQLSFDGNVTNYHWAAALDFNPSLERSWESVWALHTFPADSWLEEQLSEDIFNLTEWPHSPARGYVPTRAYLGVRSPLSVIAHVDWYFWKSNKTKAMGIRRAEKCVLTPCLKHYNVIVSQGVPNVEVADTDYGFLKLYRMSYSREASVGESIYVMCWQIDDTNVTYHDLLNQRGYRVDGQIYCTGDTSFGPVINSQLSGHAHQEIFSLIDVPSGEPVYTAYQDGQPSDFLSLIANSSLNTTMTQVAASLSKLNVDQTGKEVNGTVLDSETFVLVRWAWLVFPIALELAGGVVLVTAVLISRHHKAQLWKSSILPLIYHGVKKQEMELDRDIWNMERCARKDIVYLEQSNEHDWFRFRPR